MPSQQEVRWSQLKVGIIVLVATVILTTMLFLMTSASGLGILSHKLTITTYFENSAGLKEGAAVNLEGVTIGNVKTVTVVTDPARKLTPVKVVMKLDEKFAPSLKVDSKAALTTLGVLGDTVVDINSQFAKGRSPEGWRRVDDAGDAEPDRCGEGEPGDARERKRDSGEDERDCR